jgi:uncharacterized protein DUF4124
MTRFVLLALLFAATPVIAQVYRWVDEKGTVHYYISLHRGMSEGELITIAGAPDMVFSDVFADKRYTYLPTSSDPFTTTITVIGGRINHIERVRKF